MNKRLMMTESDFNRFLRVVEKSADDQLGLMLHQLSPFKNHHDDEQNTHYHIVKDEIDKRKTIREKGEQYKPKSDRQLYLEEKLKAMRWVVYVFESLYGGGERLPTTEFIRTNGLEDLNLVTVENSTHIPEAERTQYIHDSSEKNRLLINMRVESIKNELFGFIDREEIDQDSLIEKFDRACKSRGLSKGKTIPRKILYEIAKEIGIPHVKGFNSFRSGDRAYQEAREYASRLKYKRIKSEKSKPYSMN